MTADARTDRTTARRELKRRLRALYFKRGYDDMVQEHIGSLMEPLMIGDTGRMLVLVGETHVGKSSVVNRALARDSDLRAMQAPDVTPVLTVELSSAVNPIQLGREILEAAGYPLGPAMSDGRTWERVRQQLQLRKVKVLWVDEAQHMIHVPKDGKFKDTQYVEYVTNKFKGLMKKRPYLSVILSGLPPLAKFVERDGQVEKMGAFADILRMSLERKAQDDQTADADQATDGVVADVVDAAEDHTVQDDVDNLWDAVDALATEARLGIEGLDQSELVPRLMHASGYSWGFALRIAIEAVLEAAAPTGVGRKVRARDAELRLPHFATVYGRWNGSVLERNPFIIDEWSKLDCSRVLQKLIVAK